MIPPLKSRKRKPLTIHGIAAKNARRARMRDAVRLNCREREVLDVKAEAIWAEKYAQQECEYYSDEFRMSALRRRSEGPKMTYFKREKLHWDPNGYLAG